VKHSGVIPVTVTDVDNGNKSICHHSDDDRRGANSRNLVQWTVLSCALCKWLFSLTIKLFYVLDCDWLTSVCEEFDDVKTVHSGALCN
jgi:hypothetical protein